AAAEDLAPLSEHEWRIELKPEGGALPASFRFPAVKPELAKEDGLIRQRYVDVDLQPVGGEIALDGGGKRLAPLLAGGAALLALIAGVFAFLKRRKPARESGPDLLPLPAHINAVSVIGYLRRIQRRDGLAPELKQT